MDKETELWRTHRSMQEKQAYFLMAASGACIGFALTQSKDMALTSMMAPLGAALLFWAVSFLLGCRHIEQVLAITFSNLGLIRIQTGRDPRSGRDPQLIALGDEVLKEIISDQQTKSVNASKWQSRCLILGTGCYVAWQVLLMHSRIPV